MKPKVLILYGYGINCDKETEYAFELVGGKVERVHLKELIEGKKKLKNYQILVLPGGFSFGDDLGAGKVLAVKIKFHLKENLQEFIEEGKLIIGICNGFQVLVKLGLLPDKDFIQKVTLTFNERNRFEDRWVYLKVNQKSPCIFTKGIDFLYLPVRHAEGKFVFGGEKVKGKILRENQIVLQYSDKEGNLLGYPFNPNGSQLNVAGICDETGRIFGLMPHPEAFLFPQNHPRWTREKVSQGEGQLIFQNAINFVKKEL